MLAASPWSSAAAAGAPSGSDGAVAKTGNGDDRWTALGRRIGCNGQVIAAVAAPDGSIYYGGGFTHCGNVAASNVVRYDPATQAWSSLGTGPDQGTQGGIVRALAIGGDA